MNDILNWFKAEFTNPITAVAQLVGFAPMLISYFVFLFNDRRKIISLKAVSDLLWSIHFFLLGELSGGVINAINVMRNIIFYKKRENSGSAIVIPIIFCIITAIGTLLSWNGARSIFPLTGSCLAVIGLWCNKPDTIRKFNFPAVSLWLIYGIITCSISTIICNSVLIMSILTAEIKEQSGFTARRRQRTKY